MRLICMDVSGESCEICPLKAKSVLYYAKTS